MSSVRGERLRLLWLDSKCYQIFFSLTFLEGFKWFTRFTVSGATGSAAPLQYPALWLVSFPDQPGYETIHNRVCSSLIGHQFLFISRLIFRSSLHTYYSRVLSISLFVINTNKQTNKQTNKTLDKRNLFTMKFQCIQYLNLEKLWSLM